MHEYEINETTWNSIQLVNAIKNNDEESVSKLFESAFSPERASEVIRANSTNFVSANEAVNSFKHSLFWVAPIIIKVGASEVLPGTNGAIVPFACPSFLPALSSLFSIGTEIRHLSGLVSHSAITGMNPCEVYEACKVFAGKSKNPSLKFKYQKNETGPGLPELCFAIGTASGFNSKPVVNTAASNNAFKFCQLFQSALQFNIGAKAVQADNVQCMTPMELSEGLYMGIKRWLTVIHETHVFVAVGLALEKAGCYGFKLYIQANEDSPIESIEWSMKTTQIAEARIAEICQWLDGECAIPLEMKRRKKMMMH